MSTLKGQIYPQIHLAEDYLIPGSPKNISTSLLTEISKRAGGSFGRGVTVLDAGHLQQLLGHGGGHDASSAGRGDEPHPDGATLAGHLGVRALDVHIVGRRGRVHVDVLNAAILGALFDPWRT